MQGNGTMWALVLILALTMACGSENQGGREEGPGTTGCSTENRADGKRRSRIGGQDHRPGSGLRGEPHLKTGPETILVYLGPGWFLEKQDLTFAPKDEVEITGSQITFQGKPTIIAAQVKKGDKSLRLRDPAGIPAWAGTDNHSVAIIGKWLLQEMIENSEFKHPNETAEKKWGNLEIFSTNTLEFYSSDTRGKWNVLTDGSIKVVSDYWGTFFLSTEGDKLIMTFPEDQIKYIYKKIN